MLMGQIGFKHLLIASILIIVLGSLSYWLINDYLPEKRLAKNLENRVLLIVIENNFNLSFDIQEEYKKNKDLVDRVFSFLFKVKKEELKDKDLLEIVDIYGENYLVGRYKKAAAGYGKIVVLSDQRASYDNFKKVLLALNGEGKTIDIVFNLHGGPSNIYFYYQSVPKHAIGYDEDFLDQKPLNIGYIYQTLCYGGDNLEAWSELGAQVAAGSKEINNYVLLAPEKFLYEWTHGETYYDAVNNGFEFEVSVWKFVSKFFPTETFSVKDDDLKTSRMIFIGDKDYKLE